MKRIAHLFSIVAIGCMLLMSSNLSAQTSVNGKDCIGIWKTVDDESGRTKSHVQVFKVGDKYHAKIVKLLDPKSLEDSGEERFEDIKCTKCPADHGKDKPLYGLEIIWGMEKSSDKWKGGSIMDPKKGKVYTCTMWMDESDSSGNQLSVRGWVGFFYRTQTWYRVK
ncbi:DUF2147 domain-containing protein [Aureispira anguillae]|uniref:DUF2147 domain-containing protein n=1 Tax=Aureispira anguillae TaxID=2864201 RepID=A0A915YKM8_9BACT|nr:DUF2147 domain-containing protein [Aureispira anguillae]BDS14975.1 DUF2147 domain-containing protein [Aureispira anguillae]